MVTSLINKLARSMALVLLLLLFAGADYIGNKQFERSKTIMNTVFEVTVFESGLGQTELVKVLDESFSVAEDIARKTSAFEPEGLAYQVAHANEGDALPLEADLFSILKDAFEIMRLSEGAFDITDEPLKAAWRAAKEKAELPDPAALTSLLPTVGISRLSLDTQNQKLVVNKAGTHIDLKGLARAYALDKIARFLKDNGIRSAVVNNGESIRFIGLSSEGRNWRMGIEHPRKPDEYAAVLELPEGFSITTTGDYLDFVMVDGKRYPMQPDPHTGQRPANAIAGVTVIAKKTSLSFATATAFFVLGPEKGHELVEKLKSEEIEAVCVEEPSPDKFVLTVSEGVQSYLRDIRV